MTKEKQEETLENENENLSESSEISALQDLVEKLSAENQKLENDYIRAHAEMENVRKRAKQEIDKNFKFAVSRFAKDVLVVADNLKRAIESVPQENREQSEQIKNLISGVEMTQSELENILSKNDVTKIESVGKIFNPHYHQVISEVQNTEEYEGTIIQELQTGYMIGDRILREAMVIVTKGGKKAEISDENEIKINQEV